MQVRRVALDCLALARGTGIARRECGRGDAHPGKRFASVRGAALENGGQLIVNELRHRYLLIRSVDEH